MKYWIQINEIVAAYVKFTAVDDQAALEEAKKLWDEGEISFDRGVADVWNVRLEVINEDGTDCRQMEYNPFPYGAETAFDRFPGAREYYARYLATRSASASVEAGNESCDVDRVLAKLREDYQAGRNYGPPYDTILFSPKVKVSRSRGIAPEAVVAEIHLSEVC